MAVQRMWWGLDATWNAWAAAITYVEDLLCESVNNALGVGLASLKDRNTHNGQTDPSCIQSSEEREIEGIS